MKNFLYCQSEEGGMEVWEFTDPDELNRLYSWMDEKAFCATSDSALLRWLGIAEVGEYHDHRLGVCIRLKDKE